MLRPSAVSLRATAPTGSSKHKAAANSLHTALLCVELSVSSAWPGNEKYTTSFEGLQGGCRALSMALNFEGFEKTDASYSL